MLCVGHVNSLRCRLILGCAIAAVNAPASFAQTAAPNTSRESSDAASDTRLEEIIVTAQKRSESLIDVPISIAAVTGDQLTQLGITSTDELEKVVPGFTYKPGRTGPPVYSIRGIGFDDTGIGSAPTVSVSVDQIPLPFLIMTPAASMDIQRVEVLKGPQGTLFGQNTTGGAINFIAAKPTADWHAGFDLTYGRFNEIDGDGYVSGPITDTLRMRVAAKHENRDGWQISETRPDDRLGKRDFTAGRLLLDWTPTDRLSFEFNVNGWMDKSELQAAKYLAFKLVLPAALGGSTTSTTLAGNRQPTGDDARRADWFPDFNHSRDDTQHQFSLRADWIASDEVTVTSLSSYAKLKSAVPTDTSGTNFPLFTVTQHGDIETYSQELRAAVSMAGINLTAGGNYEHDDTKDFYFVDNFEVSNNQLFNPFQPALGFYKWNKFVQEVNQKTDTYALFASADVPITSTLTAQAGARYTKQNRDFNGCLRDAGDGNLAGGIALVPTFPPGPPFFGPGLPYDPAPPGGCVSLDANTFNRLPIVTDELNQNNVSWRAGLNWKPDTDSLVYGNVTRGFKAGTFTPVPAIFSNQMKPVTQEKVTAYEVGAKATLLNRKLEISTAVFYDEYLNKQLLGFKTFPVFGSLPTLQNIPESTVLGAELNINARPIRGLTLAGGVTYVETKVTQSFNLADPFNVNSDVKGDPFPNAPRWQGNANAIYEFPISSSLTASLGGDVSYRSSTYSTFSKNPVLLIKSYALVGLRAGIGTSDDRWRMELWGKNVTDKFYLQSIFSTGDTLAEYTGMPATYGVTLRARF